MDNQRPVTSDSPQVLRPASRTLKSRIILVLKGFCMGTADVIPGVSGGTMALILGIYRELIMAIKSFDIIWVKSLTSFDYRLILSRPHFGFLLPLFTGIVCALLFFTRIIPLPELLLIYPEQIYGLFFGLIAGSCVVLIRNLDIGSPMEYVMLLPGLVVGLVVFNLVPVSTPDAAWFIFLSGSLAICAMILPGISGSFILLILNKYAYLFNAIGYFKLSVLLPFVLGAITGLVIFSRLLAWILDRYYRRTILCIIGLLLASLWVIWPFQDRQYETVGVSQRLVSSSPGLPEEYNSLFYVSIMLILAGIIIVIVMDHVAARHQSNNV